MCPRRPYYAGCRPDGPSLSFIEVDTDQGSPLFDCAVSFCVTGIEHFKHIPLPVPDVTRQATLCRIPKSLPAVPARTSLWGGGGEAGLRSSKCNEFAT
eukprot:649433-Prymnesium_polylepis.1